MSTLWLIEWNNSRLVPEPRLCPDFEEATGIEVVVADTHFVIVHGGWDAVNNAISGYAYWGPPRVPKAGKWISAGGDETYIDDQLNIVKDAEAVIHSLNDPALLEMLTHTEAEDVLEAAGRVF